jgi:hypothetical protein
MWENSQKKRYLNISACCTQKNVMSPYHTIRHMFNEISLELYEEKIAAAILSLCDVARKA